MKGIRAISVLILLVFLLSLYGFLVTLPRIIGEEETAPPFDVDQVSMKVLIKADESLSRVVKIMNVGDSDLDFSIDVSPSISDILNIQEKIFSLKPGQVKNLQVSFSSITGTTEYVPGVYSGKMFVRAGQSEKIIPIVVEVESGTVLFDTNLAIEPIYRTVFPGDTVVVDVKLFNLQGIAPTSVKMEYFVKDFDGNVIITESETSTVATTASFTKTFKIPQNLKSGSYVFSVNAEYGSSVGTSSYSFDIVERSLEINSIISQCSENMFCLFGALVVIIVIIVFGSMIYIFSLLRVRTRVVEKKPAKISGGFGRWLENRRKRKRLKEEEGGREREREERLERIEIARKEEEMRRKERKREEEIHKVMLDKERRKKLSREKLRRFLGLKTKEKKKEIEREKKEEKKEILREIKEQKIRKREGWKFAFVKLGLMKTKEQKVKEAEERALEELLGKKKIEEEKKKRLEEKQRKESEEQIKKEEREQKEKERREKVERLGIEELERRRERKRIAAERRRERLGKELIRLGLVKTAKQRQKEEERKRLQDMRRKEEERKRKIRIQIREEKEKLRMEEEEKKRRIRLEKERQRKEEIRIRKEAMKKRRKSIFRGLFRKSTPRREQKFGRMRKPKETF